jgi:outer membrane lipoprotein-sorting protein
MNRSACLAVFSSAILLLAADPLAEVFARMDKVAQTFRGMTANIEEIVHTEIVNDNTISTGTIKLKSKPGDTRFLVDFTNPDAPRSASFAGTEARLYNPKTKTVQIYNTANKESVMEQVFLLGFGATSSEIKANYDVSWVGTEDIDGKPAGHIKLIPKSKDVLMKLKQADLWISDSLGMPVQQKFTTTSAGDYTLLKYSNIKLAPSLSNRDVEIKVPKGTEQKRVGS